MKNKSWRGLAGLAWIACAAAVHAQTPSASTVPVIGDSIDVRLVNVEVAVTDRRGQRVASLKPGDFRLKVDGKLVPIEFFTEVSDGQAAPATAAETSAATVPGAEPGTPIEAGVKVEGALLFGEMPDSEPLTIQAGRPVAGKKRGVREIPLALEIPVSAVTLLEENGRYEARAELRFAAIDDEGNQSSVPPVAIRLSSPRPPVAGAQVHYSTSLFLHGRASHLVAAIYDPLTGKVAAGRTDLTIP